MYHPRIIFSFRLVPLGVAIIYSLHLSHQSSACPHSLHLWISSEVFLFPSKFSVFCPVYPLSLLYISEISQPCLSNLVSKSLDPAVPHMYSFLILSLLVTANETFNIFRYVSSNFSSIFASNSKSYIIAGPTILQTFKFLLAALLLSQISLYTQFYPRHPACTLFISLVHSPSL